MQPITPRVFDHVVFFRGRGHTMRFSVLITSVFAVIFCWFLGINIGLAETIHEETVGKHPYRMVMQEAVDGLRQFGIQVEYPKELPSVIVCGECLLKQEAFGAYSETLAQVVVPDGFDIEAVEGQSILVHEYAHYLMTKAGIPPEDQEEICLKLGNLATQRFFKAAMS